MTEPLHRRRLEPGGAADRRHAFRLGLCSIASIFIACAGNSDRPAAAPPLPPAISGAARCAAIQADSIRELRDTFRLAGTVEPTWVELFDGPKQDTEIVVTYYRQRGQSHQAFIFEGGRLLCVRVDDARFEGPGSQRVVERSYRHVTYRDTAVELLDGAGGDTIELRADALRALAHTLLARADTLRRAAALHHPPPP